MALLCLALENEKRDEILHYLPPVQTLDSLADFFSAFSDRTRLKIISALSVSELCVNDIALILKLNQTTVSHQLKLLRSLGIVECKRDGKIIFYKISNRYVNEILLSGAEFVL